MTQPLYTVRQVAYVVRDMEKALKYWTEYLKVGPFFMLEHAPLENQKYRGGASNADISMTENSILKEVSELCSKYPIY